ncbi:MAG: DNA alkylation repair protein [Candidatus Azobacteroides sp.]|nr:DNA alkylation repair protein [Candidatus Azobacteroides sp.]
MTLFKDLYTKEFYRFIGGLLADIYPAFSVEFFIKKIFHPSFSNMEYKERMRHTTLTIHSFLPESFKEAAELLIKLTEELQKRELGENNSPYMFIPDYIEVYGLDHYQISIHALEKITQFISCEFAVRPFIIKYDGTMIEQMIRWSKHPHPMVRRLASEGTRPRLPWAMAFSNFKKDPTPILPVLENLKNDPDECVRRSVANNLNDISKDHPELIIEIARNWHGNSKETDKIIKHACRTLLKKGNPEILKLYNLNDNAVEVQNIVVQEKTVLLGNELCFSFEVENKEDKEQLIRIEYAIYFLKSNGKLSPKVFKISERTFTPSEKRTITRKHSFKPITTRTFYEGKHKVAVIVNGKESLIEDFLLKLKV